MSALVDRAIEAAGLGPLLAARRAGAASSPDAAFLRSVDLLALGALADRVRRDEVGDEVRVYTRAAEDDDSSVDDGAAEAGARPRAIVLPPEGRMLTGLELLREVAIARVTGHHGARVRVDWARSGLELAQVALGFGANELEGRIANKRGLPMAEGEKLGVLGKASRLEDADVVKRKELEGFVRRAGRTPRFAEEAP
jgi:2-iminoacetate synthase ThiH